MLQPRQLTVHALTLRQLASAGQVAEITGQPVAEAEAALREATADGTVMAARGSYLITPAGRAGLDALYPVAYAALRADAAVAASMDAFESGVNKQLLALTSDWQVIESGGATVANDHSDASYDDKILARLGRVLDKAAIVLAPVARADPLTGRFLDRLATALTKAEGGETDYVSGVRVDSVHAVWFQMHEHLLRLAGRERAE